MTNRHAPTGGGFSCSAQFFLNNTRIALLANDFSPFQIKIDKSLLFPDKKNVLICEMFQPASISEGYPQFVHLFSDAKFSGITRPLFLSISPVSPFSNFSCTVDGISGKKATLRFSYTLSLKGNSTSERIDVEENIGVDEGKIIYRKK